MSPGCSRLSCFTFPWTPPPTLPEDSQGLCSPTGPVSPHSGCVHSVFPALPRGGGQHRHLSGSAGLRRCRHKRPRCPCGLKQHRSLSVTRHPHWESGEQAAGLRHPVRGQERDTSAHFSWDKQVTWPHLSYRTWETQSCHPRRTSVSESPEDNPLRPLCPSPRP